MISTAVLATADGVNKTQYLTVSGTPKLTAAMNNHIGVTCCVRTTTVMAGKGHFEVTIDSVGTSGLIEIGLVDLSVALGPAVFSGIHAGNGSVAGVSITFNGTLTNINVNGAATGGTAPALAAGDIIVVEYDPTATNPPATFVHKRGATETALASVTLTSNIPTNPTAYVGGATNNGAGDGVTVNFGATTFAKTPNTGYGIYG